MFKLAVVLCLVAFTAGLPAVPNVDPRIDPSGSWKVVGGADAADGQYPFMVSLQSSANSHFCGGTILNTQWILTAAHCLVGRTAESCNVVAGSNTLSSGGVIHASKRLTVHSNYNSTTIANDLAVIQLVDALTYSSKVAAVTLNTANTGSVAATLVGWGATSTGSAIPNNLQHLPTKTITHRQCKASWGSSVTSRQICAVIGKGQGACHGDSGGPLLQSSNGNQLGITSFILSGGCAQGSPDVYSRVSSYVDWISSAISSE